MEGRLSRDWTVRAALEGYALHPDDFAGPRTELETRVARAVGVAGAPARASVRAAELLLLPLDAAGAFAESSAFRFLIASEWRRQLLEGNFCPFSPVGPAPLRSRLAAFAVRAARARALFTTVLDFSLPVLDATVDAPRVPLLPPPLCYAERESDVRARLSARDDAARTEAQASAAAAAREHALMTKEERRSQLLNILVAERKTADARERARAHAEVELITREARFAVRLTQIVRDAKAREDERRAVAQEAARTAEALLGAVPFRDAKRRH